MLCLILNRKSHLIQDYGLLLFRLILCTFSWISILLMLIPSILRFQFIILSFYTVQTNLMVLLWSTIAVFFTNKKKNPLILGPIVRGGITVYITITFLIFVILLQPFYIPIEPLPIFTNILAHYIVPILFIIDWIFTETKNKYEKRYAFYWLSYPFFYLAYSLIQGLITGFYPYYFIDLSIVGPLVFLFAAVLGVLFYSVGRLYIYMNKKIYPKRS